MRIWRTASAFSNLSRCLRSSRSCSCRRRRSSCRTCSTAPSSASKKPHAGALSFWCFSGAAADLYKRADSLPRLRRPAPATVPAGARALHLSLLRAGCRMHRLCRVLSMIRSSGTRTSVLDIPFWLFASPMLVGFTAAAAGYLYFALRRRSPPVGGAQSFSDRIGAAQEWNSDCWCWRSSSHCSSSASWCSPYSFPSLAYIWWENMPLATIGQRVLYALDSFPLVAVPVFILVGNLMSL